MKRSILAASMLIAFFLSATLRAEDKPAAAGRDADTIFKEFEAATPPTLDAAKRTDQEYIKQYLAERLSRMTLRAELAKEMADRFPDDPRTPKVRAERWTILASTGKTDVLLAEADAVLQKEPKSADALYYKATASMPRSSSAAKPADVEKTRELVESFLKAAPDDARGEMLVMRAGMVLGAEKAPFFKHIAEQYPKTPAGKAAIASSRKTDGVGKPFELAFTDAISGKPISIEGLKGKIVVIDFWATWCGPCVAEMPTMKKLYAEYKDKGVEFIGVSLDQPEDKGGLKALKAFVEKNEIGWPQYYQGNFWQSDFSKSWGINSIPCVFIVNHEGKLHSTEARGQLQKLIPELIKARDENKVSSSRAEPQ